MELVLNIIYGILLIATLSYGGLIVYHILRYKTELYDGQIPRVIAAMWFYIIVSGSILVLSFVLASLGPIITPL